MKTRDLGMPLFLVLLVAGLVVAARATNHEPPTSGGKVGVPVAAETPPVAVTSPPATPEVEVPVPTPGPIAPFLQKGIDWLAAAQHVDGGWGAGSSSNQNLRDPHAVTTDPATTAFAALALVRAGHTPTSGAYRANVEKALLYVVKAVETSAEGPRVTEIQGTQPQAKMGPLVDTSLAVQFLARVVPLLPRDHELRARADAAHDRALAKLQSSQTADGEWGKGGWANALQGSLGAVALERSAAAGKDVPQPALDRARAAQTGRMDPSSGKAEAGDAAGVELYAFAGASRNGAVEAKEARDALEEAKRSGRLPEGAEVNAENLRIAGLEAPRAATVARSYEVTRSQARRLDDASLLQGFGNNGGEEFLSYMMTSESLVIQGGEEWAKWQDKMLGLLAKVQSADGSWTGHHCITSPVFCTAAVVQTLTADHDAALLRAKGTIGKKPTPAAATR